MLHIMLSNTQKRTFPLIYSYGSVKLGFVEDGRSFYIRDDFAAH
jgi:hypothetical protein